MSRKWQKTKVPFKSMYPNTFLKNYIHNISVCPDAKYRPIEQNSQSKSFTVKHLFNKSLQKSLKNAIFPF